MTKIYSNVEVAGDLSLIGTASISTIVIENTGGVKNFSFLNAVTPSTTTEFNISSTSGWNTTVGSNYHVTDYNSYFFILDADLNLISQDPISGWVTSHNTVDNRIYISSYENEKIGLYDLNSSTFSVKYFASPFGTLWNSQYVGGSFGWSDLSDYQTRNYRSFYEASNYYIGNYVLGVEFVMWDTINDNYWKVVFTGWQNGNVGGGFTYSRSQILGANSFGPTISFVKTNYGTQSDLIGPGVEITRNKKYGIYNPLKEHFYGFERTTDIGRWNPVDNMFYAWDYTSGWETLVKFDSNLNPLLANEMKPTSPVGTLWNSSFNDLQRGGWGDLTNWKQRNYTSFINAVWYYSEDLVGQELVMWDVINDKYFMIKFDNWSGSGGAGFSYSRTEILGTNSFGPTVSFIKDDYGIQTDVIGPGIEIQRTGTSPIFNIATESNFGNFLGYFFAINSNNGDVWCPGTNGFMAIYSITGSFSFIKLDYDGYYPDAMDYNPDNDRMYLLNPQNSDIIYSIDATTKQITELDISSFFVSSGINTIKWANSKILVTGYDFTTNNGTILQIDNDDNISIVKQVESVSSYFQGGEDIGGGDFIYFDNPNFVKNDVGEAYYINQIVIPNATMSTVHQLPSVSGTLAQLSDIPSPPPPGLTAVSISTKIYYVSATKGNNSTAEVGDLSKPWLAIETACIAAANAGGGLVYVFPGIYYVTNTLYWPNVNIHFEDNCTVYNNASFTYGLFDDIGGSTGMTSNIVTVSGLATFIGSYGLYGIVRLREGVSGSVNNTLKITCKKIVSNTAVDLTVFNGTLEITCDSIEETIQHVALVGKENSSSNTCGRIIMNVGEIIDNSFYTAGSIVFYNSCRDGVERKNYVNVRKFYNISNSNYGAITFRESSSKCIVYFNGEIEHVTPSLIFLGAIFTFIYNGGTLIAEGRFSTAKCYGCVFYLMSEKTTVVIKNSFINSLATASGVYTIYCNSSNVYVKVINSTIVGRSDTTISNSSYLELHNSRIISKDPLLVSPSTGNGLLVNSGSTTIVNGCVFYSDATNGSSLTASTSQTVKFYGSSFGNFDMSPNVTGTIGSFIYDPAVTLDYTYE